MTKQLWRVIIISCIFATGCVKEDLDIAPDDAAKEKGTFVDLYKCDEEVYQRLKGNPGFLALHAQNSDLRTYLEKREKENFKFNTVHDFRDNVKTFERKYDIPLLAPYLIRYRDETTVRTKAHWINDNLESCTVYNLLENGSAIFWKTGSMAGSHADLSNAF